MEAFIPSQNLEALNKFVEKSNKKARKLGLPAFTLYISQVTELREFGPKDKPYFIEYTKIEIDGAQPVFTDWSLVAKIELVQGIGSVAKTVPGQTLPKQYLNHDNVCDHCNTKRLRNNVYIVKHTDGTYKSIGQSCLKLFLGGKDAEALIWWYSFTSSLDDIGSVDRFGSCRPDHYYFDLANVLALTACAVRTHGWTSKAVAEERGGQSTAGRVCHHMFALKVEPADRLNPIQEDIDKATATIEYFKGIANPNNEYTSNLKKFAVAGVLYEKGFGLACSMINAYNKNLEFETERKVKEERKSSKANEWIGTVGGYFDGDLTFMGSNSWAGNYGVTFFHKFEDVRGNAFTWATGKDNGLDVGTVYRVQGKIKDHSEFNKTKQTVLTRCKIV